MNLQLYTNEFLWTGKVKRVVKQLLGKGPRGPEAVARSLQIGLAELGAEFKWNQPPVNSTLANVLNGAEVLRWAIEQKRAGKIAKLVAGTNISILPRDDGGVLKHPLIDAVLVPCQWAKTAFEKDAPELLGKIHIWPAGVDVPPGKKSEKIYDFIIFNKRTDTKLADGVQSYLKAQNFKTVGFSYGSGNQRKYFSLLEQSKYLVYLGRFESQGLSMFEAWARGVPTLVLGKHDLTGLAPSPSPYLTGQTGMFFADSDDLKNVLPQFTQTQFSSRQYIEENFTHKKRAEAYLKIIEGLVNT